MLSVQKSSNTNGVILRGDFFDLDRLYFAIMKFTGFHGKDDQCVFDNCSEACENLLGLCYEIRHAWQGDRGIEEVYNGIKNEWFDDYEESEVSLYEDNDDDDDYDDDINYGVRMFRFSRKNFPKINTQNAYFSINLTFPEIVFYALILMSLLKKKDVFFQSTKNSLEQADLLQGFNKEYCYFEAEIDVARITILTMQTLKTLYQFIGEEEYFSFVNRFDQLDDFSVTCDLERINQLLVNYGKSEYKQDDPKVLMRTLNSFLK